ncbi:MAG: hypothetical protein AAGG01_05320 [Planctomycetota bacterium]
MCLSSSSRNAVVALGLAGISLMESGPGAFAQSALLREGDALPGGPAGQIIGGFGVTTVNDGLGYACTFTSGGPAGFVQGVWGSLDGGASAVLRLESTISGITQTDIESFFGINRSTVCYSSSVNTATGGSNLDSVWMDDTLFALDGQPVPGSSNILVFGSRVGITSAGDPFYAAGVSATVGGPDLGRVLFRGATRLIGFGDMLPNMPTPLSDLSIDFSFRFSEDGAHYIAPLFLELPLTEDGAMSIDGSGLLLGGALVREGQPVPASLGGDPGAWERFEHCGITAAGSYMFTGNTDGVTTTDEFIVRNGAFWLREGDTVDGQQVVDSIESAFLSGTDQLAYVWRVPDNAGNPLEALFVESTLLLKEGDPVDWDGDGVVDAGTSLLDFTGIDSISLSSAGTVYFTASVDVGGQTRQAYFAMDTNGVGTSYCAAAPNSTGAPASIAYQGSLGVTDNRAFLVASHLPTFAFSFFIVSRDRGFVAGPGGSSGNLCLGGAVGRYQNQVQSSGAQGRVAIELDLTSIPQPMGAVSGLAGDTWAFSTWFRDQGAGGAPTSNFSNGVEITLQ